MAVALYHMDCQKKRLVNGSASEAPTDFIIQSELHPGWIQVSDSYAYASATTFTIPISPLITPASGDRIRWKDGGSYKYGYVISLSGATLTINAGSDYSISNATITDVAISKMPNPAGFPSSFTWTPTYGGSGSMTWTSVTTTSARFWIFGYQLHFVLQAVGTTGGTASSALSFTLPQAHVEAGNPAFYGHVDDGGGNLVSISYANSSTVAYALKPDSSPFGLGGSRLARIRGVYIYS